MSQFAIEAIFTLQFSRSCRHCLDYLQDGETVEAPSGVRGARINIQTEIVNWERIFLIFNRFPRGHYLVWWVRVRVSLGVKVRVSVEVRVRV